MPHIAFSAPRQRFVENLRSRLDSVASIRLVAPRFLFVELFKHQNRPVSYSLKLLRIRIPTAEEVG